MSLTVCPENPQLFINSMRDYVLGPIQTAVEIVSADMSELSTEQDAFLNFIQRVRELEPEPVSFSYQEPISSGKNRSDKAREIYEETVFAVDHYHEVYDELLIENVVAELGTDAAEVLVADTGVTLIPVAKKLLINRAQQCLEKRSSVIASIAAEQKSLKVHQEVIHELVVGLTGTAVPKWYQEQFESEIATVLAKRQGYLNRRHNNKDGHEICEYLYGNQHWCYPVLTSAIRLCETTVD